MKAKVYFAAAAGRIKVGTTGKAVQDRIGQIGAYLAEPLELIGYIDGGLPLERAIQKHLQPWHLKGEWFRDCEDVRQILKLLILQGPRAIRYAGDCFSEEVRASQGLSRSSTGRNPKAIHDIWFHMWGDDAPNRLAVLAIVDEATAAAWLDDEKTIPLLVKFAIGYMVMQYVGSDDTEAVDREFERLGLLPPNYPARSV